MSNIRSGRQVKDSLRLSDVERKALSASSFREVYPPEEKIPTIVVENFPALGKLAAMRFVEWVQQNPGGVISLPTGKTPEHFIKWVQRLLRGWGQSEIQAELAAAGVDPAKTPDMKSLHFVQIDEFYPISPHQQNSFYNYVKHFYIEGFGLDPQKAMMIDCSKIALGPSEKLDEIWPGLRVDLRLRYSQPKNHLESRQKTILQRIDQWCMEYEDKIRTLGGIGFFLGGIGPDGHIGFNISGSDHYSTTRLCPINYETQAAAATDLGGMEIAKKSLVITIGLSQFNRTTSANYAERPTIQGMMGASSVENDSDCVLLLDHTRYKRTDSEARTWALLGKNRHGSTGEIPILWDYRTLRVREALPHEEGDWSGLAGR